MIAINIIELITLPLLDRIIFLYFMYIVAKGQDSPLPYGSAVSQRDDIYKAANKKMMLSTKIQFLVNV